MKTLKITPITTPIYRSSMNINEFIAQSLERFIDLKTSEDPRRTDLSSRLEGSIIAITSKIISLSEQKIVSKLQAPNKDALIQSEADYDLGKVAFDCRLTIKDGLFIPSAGIDESNSESGDYILYPDDAYESARIIYDYLIERYKLENLGVLITDSHTMPLRQGVMGIALSYWGFRGVKNMIGKQDLFGRPLKMTQMDLADGLATAAVLMMGEADESCPLALIEDAPVEFAKITDPKEIEIKPELDLYYPLYRDRMITKAIDLNK